MHLFELITSTLSTRRPHREADPDADRAAVALLLTQGTGSWDILLIKRAVRDNDPWSGQMGLPGGRWSGSDATLLDTAIRETREEVGVGLTSEALLGQLDDLHPRTKVLPPIIVRPFVFGLEVRPAINPNPEVEQYIWAPVAQLGASEQEVQIRHRGAMLRVDAFKVGPHIIWGMTHRIIKPLLDLVNV